MPHATPCWYGSGHCRARCRRLQGFAGLGTIPLIEALQMSHKIGAAFCSGRGDNQFAPGPFERAHHGNFLRLTRSRNPQVGTAPGPRTREVWMRQRFAFVAEQQHDVAGFGLCFAQFQPHPNPINGVGILTSLQGVAWPPVAIPPFLRSTLDSCDNEIVTPSLFSTSPARRASVRFVRSATGADRSGATTRRAASALTGEGPAATRALRASTPPRMKSPRHSRTVSSRTPNACEMRLLVHPASVSKMARARSASPRAPLPANASSANLSEPVARNGDLPAISRPPNQMGQQNHSSQALASQDQSA